MSRKSYSAEFKTKLVLELLQGDKDINALATQHGINPAQIRTWKKDFLENASTVFQGNKQAKEARRKETELEKSRSQMLKTIGQLTLERDFLQGELPRKGQEMVPWGAGLLSRMWSSSAKTW